jgi:hypothetical protein
MGPSASHQWMAALANGFPQILYVISDSNPCQLVREMCRAVTQLTSGWRRNCVE